MVGLHDIRPIQLYELLAIIAKQSLCLTNLCFRNLTTHQQPQRLRQFQKVGGGRLDEGRMVYFHHHHHHRLLLHPPLRRVFSSPVCHFGLGGQSLHPTQVPDSPEELLLWLLSWLRPAFSAVTLHVFSYLRGPE